MKIIQRNIFPFQEDNFFTAIRDKTDYARLVLYSARQLLLANDEVVIENPTDESARLKLIVDKMSRVFIYKGKKYLSVAFPLTTTIITENEVQEFTTPKEKIVDNQAISAAFSVLNEMQSGTNPSLIDFYIGPGSNDSSGIFLLEEIFQFEPSYVRYDHDKEREKGKIHPLNHVDINYSQYSTYKLGLSNIISPAYFENMQNIKTDCSFIID